MWGVFITLLFLSFERKMVINLSTAISIPLCFEVKSPNFSLFHSWLVFNQGLSFQLRLPLIAKSKSVEKELG